jgi:ubiquinone/menaquinone biosynthesis C-methylase UbiE
MPDYIDIYTNHADKFDYLVSREDYQKNLLRKIFTIRDIRGLEVIELGAGTGRLTFQLCPFVRHVTAFEFMDGLLKLARSKKDLSGTANCTFLKGDNLNVAARNGSADMAIEGWSFPQMLSYSKDVWQATLDHSIEEMKRIVKPGGFIFLIESLGILAEEPVEPKFFSRLYEIFETKYGFKREWVRTDYKFDTAAMAEYYVGFYFGEEAAKHIKEHNLSVVPECTGIWWLVNDKDKSDKPGEGNGIQQTEGDIRHITERL